MKLKLLVTLLSVTLANNTSAETWLDIHLLSRHFTTTYTKEGMDYAYNENNLGLGLDISRTKNSSYIVGFFDNSYNNTTVYAGMDFHSTGVLAIGISAGVATGYQNVHDESSDSYLKVLSIITFVVKQKDFRVKGGIMANGDGVTLSLGYKL